MLHGDRFSEKDMLYFAHDIRTTCIQLLAESLLGYLDDSPQVNISDVQQIKHSQFFGHVSFPPFHGMFNRKLCDLSTDVWNTLGLQDYIFQRPGYKIQQPHGNVHQVHQAQIHNHPDMQENCGVDDGGNGSIDCKEVLETTGAKQQQQQQRLYADDPATNFLPAFCRIMAEGYQPTLMDILSICSPTTGIIT